MTVSTHHIALPDSGVIELLHAEFGAQRFPRHFHDWHMIKIMEEGRVKGRYSSASYSNSRGYVFLSNPFDAHDGFSTKQVRYRAFYLPPELLRQTAPEGTMRNVAFSRPVVKSRDLHAALIRLHREYQDGERPHARFSGMLRHLLTFYGRPAPPRKFSPRVHELIDLLHSSLSCPISVQALSRELRLGRNQVTRLCVQSVGLPPYEYHLNLRLEAARRRLRTGVPLAAIAQEFGFCDQSHFSRHFKRYYGYSPGLFVRTRIQG